MYDSLEKVSPEVREALEVLKRAQAANEVAPKLISDELGLISTALISAASKKTKHQKLAELHAQKRQEKIKQRAMQVEEVLANNLSPLWLNFADIFNTTYQLEAEKKADFDAQEIRDLTQEKLRFKAQNHLIKKAIESVDSGREPLYLDSLSKRMMLFKVFGDYNDVTRMTEKDKLFVKSFAKTCTWNQLRFAILFFQLFPDIEKKIQNSSAEQSLVAYSDKVASFSAIKIISVLLDSEASYFRDVLDKIMEKYTPFEEEDKQSLVLFACSVLSDLYPAEKVAEEEPVTTA